MKEAYEELIHSYACHHVTYLPTDLPLPAWFVSFGGREGGIGARACGFVVAVCV